MKETGSILGLWGEGTVVRQPVAGMWGELELGLRLPVGPSADSGPVYSESQRRHKEQQV